MAVYRLSLHRLSGTSIGKAGAGEGRLGIAATGLRVSDPTVAFFAAALAAGSVLWAVDCGASPKPDWRAQRARHRGERHHEDRVYRGRQYRRADGRSVAAGQA